MFHTYLLVPGEIGVGIQDHLPSLALAHRPAKDVGVVGDDTLDARLMVHVLDPVFAGLLLRIRNPVRGGAVFYHVPLLHT